VLTEAAEGEWRTTWATGPRGETVEARIGRIEEKNIPEAALQLLGVGPLGDVKTPRHGHIAVIEMAQASGLALVPAERRNPWWTTSFGAGEMIRAASEQGAAGIVLGVGGSATNDLGLGALTALGWRAVDRAGKPLWGPPPAQWGAVRHLEGTAMSLPPLRIACDVTNPLLGPDGATAIYGPQKGLSAETAAAMEQAVAEMAARMEAHAGGGADHRNTPGAGAAGGIAFGLMTAAGARIVSGFDLVAAWCDLETRIRRADIVITGEGRFDRTSWAGKGPGAIARRAAELGKRVHVFAGAVVNAPADGVASFHAITPAGVPLDAALAATRANLAATTRAVFA
jgi:glycerate kinase